MKLGNAAWGLREMTFKEQLALTKRMGLTILEVGIANAPLDISLEISKKELDRIAAEAADSGIELLCGATGDDFMQNGAKDLDKVKRVIDICQYLKIKYLRIFAGFTPMEEQTEENYRYMAAALREVCVYAEEKNVIPAMETHGSVVAWEEGVQHKNTVTTDINALGRLLEALPDNLTLCFDPANLYAVGMEKPEELFLRFRERIGYVHLKDFVKAKNGLWKPSWCGAGTMDWTSLLTAMADYHGAALFEYENTEDVEAGLQKCMQYVKARL